MERMSRTAVESRSPVMRRKVIAAFVVSVVALGGGLSAQASPAFPKAVRAGPPTFTGDPALRSAVDGAQRIAANRARDVARHPIETLTFWGLQPGATVVEISPGSGYWTEILAPYAKATGGRYTAVVSVKGQAAFAQTYGDTAKFGTVGTVLSDAAYGPPGSADMVITARNVHNFIWSKSLDEVLAKSFAALKPGGVLAVEEHRADPRPMVQDARDGYVSIAVVVAAAEKAGFRLEAQSQVNANPRDTKDHPFGVWTLPPSRQSAPSGQPADPAFDHTKYDAIGESDRMTLRFVKPA